jgi:phospholipid transport system substrate-binding protein
MRKFLIFMLCAFLPTAYAQSSDSPEEMVKSVTNEVIEILKTDPQLKNGDPHRAAELIQEKVLPHFNFKHMTALAMGQNWRKATPEQQKVLMEEFRTLLVRT